MRHRHSTACTMWTAVICILLGMVLAGPVAQAAESFLKAVPSTHTFYVDGQQVQMTAYNIAGNNFVKLRDIGQAVGFNVYWADGVRVESNTPYTGEAPTKPTAQVGAPATETLQISSMKGTELTAGDRSSLLIKPAGTGRTVVSSDPSVAALEQVTGYWVIVAQAPGTAMITVTNNAGETGTLAVTVKADTSAPAEIDLNANMDIRLEMVRLINEVRRENSLSELPINNALMNAAQDVSAQCFSDHQPYESIILPKYGWPYGAAYNLATMGRADFDDAARIAVSGWINSPGHLQTMLEKDAACVGTGITNSGGRVYCYMAVGAPNWGNAYT